MSFLGVSVNSGLSTAGRAAVYLGEYNSGTALADAVYNVGALEGTVSVSPNQDIIKLQRSDGQNPYAVLETAYDFQVTFTVQETDIFNLGMSLSYNVNPGGSATASPTGSAILWDTDGLIGTSAAGIDPTGGSLDTLALQLGSDYQSPYRSMLIRVEGGLNAGAGARTVSEWHFYKVKIQATGSIDYDRTGAVTYPVTAHCLGNNSDVVGRMITPNTFSRTNYYGDS